jgi:hypothetical protein
MSATNRHADRSPCRSAAYANPALNQGMYQHTLARILSLQMPARTPRPTAAQAADLAYALPCAQFIGCIS